MEENNTPDPRKEFFATIGYSLIMEMKRNREFRRKIEKTEFGKATKRYLIQVFGQDANTKEVRNEGGVDQ